MKMTIGHECPSCHKGDVVFDYYLYDIHCLSCGSRWMRTTDMFGKSIRVLSVTNVGSHMWKMNHAKSDTDLFEIFVAPTHQLLIGKQYKSSQQQEKGVDRVSHEIGKVVDMILKNNVNFIWGVTSPNPLQVYDKMLFNELQNLTVMNLSKKIYNSTHGLAVHNYKKYIESGKDNSKKRCNIIIRTLVFVCDILREGGLRYLPVANGTSKMVLEWIDNLDEMMKITTLPNEPEYKDELMSWLYKVRMSFGFYEYMGDD